MKIIYQFILAISVLLVFYTSCAWAELKHNSSFYYLASNQLNGISEQEAVKIAQKQINGRVLTISRVNDAYRIKILTNQSTVHIVTVNVMSGKIISTH